jgi:hypothetical protein
MIRKIITSMLWDLSDSINFIASEYVCPPRDRRQERSDEMRDRIASVLLDHWPVPFDGTKQQRNKALSMADAVIHELVIPTYE